MAIIVNKSNLITAKSSFDVRAVSRPIRAWSNRRSNIRALPTFVVARTREYQN